MINNMEEFIITGQPPKSNYSVSVVATAGASGGGDGRKVVASAGVAEALASDTPCKQVTIMAEGDNTGAIVVGFSTVVASEANRRGIPLLPYGSVTISIDNLSKIYLDAEQNGEGVTYIYLT
jgi:hypothetical protein